MTELTSPTGRVAAATYPLDGKVAGDHWFDLPLDHLDPARGRTEVYVRELRDPETADRDLPYLLFLQGGPGGPSPRPNDGPAWIGWALERYRVLLIDQRGTGRSNRLDPAVIGSLGSPQQQADHLALFRADSIVQDAEAVRRQLLGDAPWTVLGQSFGGFCTFTYLSFAPAGLHECLVTGGIPPLATGIDDVYRSTYAAVRRRVDDLDAAYPLTRARLREVADHLEIVDELLPSGEPLTVPRLQEVGQVLGGEDGPLRLHYLAEDAWAGDRLSESFLQGVQEIIGGYRTAPLYALLHEACYCDLGQSARWSAERVRPEFPWVDAADGPLGLTGEAIYRHTVAGCAGLEHLAETAELLMERTWERPLYDLDALSHNEIPVAARAYAQDMYVTLEVSQAAAALVPGVRVVVDEQHHHDGLRKHGATVLGGLRDVLDGEAAP
jgi:pimeloyl-ACP methyl ester carboxylesterase